MYNKIKPIYTCHNHAGVKPGPYFGVWSDSAINFYYNDQPAQIHTGDQKPANAFPVFVVILPQEVYVYSTKEISES